MVLLILSDSHGHLDNMYQAIERSSPDAIVHLGDCWRDSLRLQARYPDLPLFQVAGNCDFDLTAPRQKVISLEGHQILLCHGDRYGVKSSLTGLRELSQKHPEVELILFGHTHRPTTENLGRIILLNPGSIGSPHNVGGYSYATATLQPGQSIYTRLWSLFD